MRKRVSALGLAAALLLGPAADVSAQTTTQVPATQETEDDDAGKWGLLGLIGLAGLAGLLPRRRPRENIASRSIRDSEPPLPPPR